MTLLFSAENFYLDDQKRERYNVWRCIRILNFHKEAKPMILFNSSHFSFTPRLHNGAF
jgi:hypothetical protein